MRTIPTTRRARRVIAAVVGGLLSVTALAAIPAGAQAVSPARDGASTATNHASTVKPTVVLVHGAFADASGWGGVITRLTRDGYPVRALPNPLRGLSSDSAYLRSFLDTVPGPVVLVGHSYGGAVITNAAAGDPDVKALVYIAAFAPEAGENLSDLTTRTVAHPAPALPVQSVPYVKADGTPGLDLYLDPAHFRAAFAADLPQRLTTVMAATQRPADTAALSDDTTAAAWHQIPSWYLVATQDQAISPDLERFMAKRAHAHTVEVKAAHAAMVSRPGAVTRLIESAARSTD